MGNIAETTPLERLKEDQEEMSIEEWKRDSQSRDMIITVPSKEAYDALCLWIIKGRRTKALNFEVFIREDW
tara:strand:+ start:300 stop:512 length:213 start_codon:yes stop_codon:yes gene_type:complete